MKRVLVVDDDQAMLDLLEDALRRRGWETQAATSGQQALDLLADLKADAVVTDLRMPGMDGIELCERVRTQRPDVPVLVTTGFGSVDAAVAAMHAGAADFVTKPYVMDELALKLDRALDHGRVLRELEQAKRAAARAGRFGDLLGESAAMRKLFELLDRVAASAATVLVVGETGTGKELVARSLHERSPRSSGAFVALNCAAMPEALLESELFGHVKGAFTDARTAHTGLMLKADGGTLFLDEVTELPLTLQPKLLRALQERRVRPVGASDEVAFDARVVAASNRDLGEAVTSGAFREDLYFRLDVLQVRVPPLRERGEDVLRLARAFLVELAEQAGRPTPALGPEAARALLAHRWPGNVRELRNAMERAVALCRDARITVGDLPERVRGHSDSSVPGREASTGPEENPSAQVGGPAGPASPRLEDVERSHILAILDQEGGSRTHAARILGIDRKTLYRKLAGWGL